MSLEDLLVERIISGGPMSVAEYMEQALTHPEYGYYMRRDPFGVNGDSDSGADACADAAGTDVGDNDSDSDANVGDFLFATDNSFAILLSIRPCAASITAFLMRSLDLDFARVVRCALTPLWCISLFFSIIF